MNQIREIARIPASDDDGDRVRGLFLAGHEIDGTAEWQVRDGQLVISPADARHQHLDGWPHPFRGFPHPATAQGNQARSDSGGPDLPQPARCQYQVACSASMNTQRFWQLVETARDRTPDPDDAEAVARQATSLLATHPAEEIVTAQRVLWELMADSYTNPLWAAAYLINGGCSDDGFEYFRGWLITQGREVFERVVADPDTLAEMPVVQASATDGTELDGEETLSIARNAHLTATGRQLPDDAFTIRYPELRPVWDFDDRDEMARRLPRLTALYPG